MGARREHIQKVLQSIGLSDSETLAYLLLTKMGTAAASTVAKHTGLTRPTAQHVCNQLASMGVVRKAKRKNTYLYSIEAPERLLSLLERRQQRLRNQEERVEGILGDLHALHTPQWTLPRTRFFEGKHGVLDAYNEILESIEDGSELLSFLKPLDLPDTRFAIEKDAAAFVQGRISKQVSTRIIGIEGETLQKHYATNENLLRETRILPTKPWQHDAVEILLFENTMYSITVEHETLFACMVENPAIVDMHRQAFEHLWPTLAKC